MMGHLNEIRRQLFFLTPQQPAGALLLYVAEEQQALPARREPRHAGIVVERGFQRRDVGGGIQHLHGQRPEGKPVAGSDSYDGDAPAMLLQERIELFDRRDIVGLLTRVPLRLAEIYGLETEKNNP